MLKHIVWWTLKEEAENATAKENALKIKEIAEALVGKIDGLESLEVAITISETSTVDADVVLQSVHTSKEALQIYAEHPEHQKVGVFIKKVVASRGALDYEI